MVLSLTRPTNENAKRVTETKYFQARLRNLSYHKIFLSNET